LPVKKLIENCEALDFEKDTVILEELADHLVYKTSSLYFIIC